MVRPRHLQLLHDESVHLPCQSLGAPTAIQQSGHRECQLGRLGDQGGNTYAA